MFIRAVGYGVGRVVSNEVDSGVIDEFFYNFD